MKKDDSSLSPEQLDNIKIYARGLLHKADAFGQYPTPVDHLIKTANLFVNQEISLGKDENIISKFKGKLGKIARPHIHGLKKLLGCLYVPSGEILLDHYQHEKKKVFVKLHETGHGTLPHQRKMFEFMEDGVLELDPDIEDLFEREANNFAVETLFQLDTFEKIAADYQISIKTPIDLSKKFGSSIYASMRRYVNTHFASLALVVYDLPNNTNPDQFCLRRSPMYSSSFIKKFGPIGFPISCTKDSYLGSILKHARFQTNHLWGLKDLNGELHDVGVHIFSNSYETFVMIIPLRKHSGKSSFPLCLN